MPLEVATAESLAGLGTVIDSLDDISVLKKKIFRIGLLLVQYTYHNTAHPCMHRWSEATLKSNTGLGMAPECSVNLIQTPATKQAPPRGMYIIESYITLH